MQSEVFLKEIIQRVPISYDLILIRYMINHSDDIDVIGSLAIFLMHGSWNEADFLFDIQ